MYSIRNIIAVAVFLTVCFTLSSSDLRASFLFRGTVFIDENLDGNFSFGDEAGIEGITVELFEPAIAP